MPYNVGSPLESGAAALAGFLQGTNAKKLKQQEDERQSRLDTQAQADTQARLGLERSNADALNTYRAGEAKDRAARLDIDRANSDRAATTAAQVNADRTDAATRKGRVDAFQAGGLHYPKNWATMKPEAKIGYLQVRLNKAQQAGDKDTVRDTETEINRVATEAEQARRDAALAKQRDIQNQQGQQRIQISVDRAGATAGRASAAAGDPQSFADVSGRLAHAKTRDDAQKILDSPEGSLLSDRQYTRLQKQVDETYGTHNQADPHKKDAPGIKPRNLNSSEQRQFSNAVNRLPKPDPGGAALQALAKNWNMPLDQAASFVH